MRRRRRRRERQFESGLVLHTQKGLSLEEGRAFFVVRPSRALPRRWKSSPEQVPAREGKRKGAEVTNRLEEAWNEAVGR